MTETVEDDPEAARPATEAVGEAVGGRRVLTVLGTAFWAWLSIHWVYRNGLLDAVLTSVGLGGVLRSGVNVRDREPFVPGTLLERVADALSEVAAGLGVVGTPVGWLAWLVDAAALGVDSMPALAAGAWLTVLLTVASILLGLCIAVPLAVARVYGGPVLGAVALVYTELIRGTPLLAQLFVLFFGLQLQGFFDGLPGVGGTVVPSTPVLVAIVGFTINSSAYQAEYIRSALTSVDAGQLTAARAVGLSKLEGIRHVVLPQGLRYAIPGWTNEFVYLVKYSSLAAFISVPELFNQARGIGTDLARTTEMYVVLAVFYLVLVLTAAALMGRFETRVAIPGVGSVNARD
jgi:polar amino acid transport system permease protein